MSRFLSFIINRIILNLPRKVTEKRIIVEKKLCCKTVEKHVIKIRKTQFETKNKFLQYSDRNNFLTRYFSWVERHNNMTELNECIAAIYELPPEVKGMKKLDKSLFKKTCKVPGLKVPQRSIGKLAKSVVKKKLLKIPKVKHIAELDESDPDRLTHKLAMFNPKHISKPDDFTEEEKTVLKDLNVDFKKMESWSMELGFENLSSSEAIRAILPNDIKDSVAGFSVIGHIAHLNLKDEVLDFKYIIGEVILEKNPPIRTVINKLDIIDNTYRNIQLELLAGEEDYNATVKESDCLFQFDFSKVYWNTRLATEHGRIVQKLTKGDVLYDVFAGVGPFSIPAAKKKVSVLANDLNPDSYKSLENNIPLNKIKPEMIRTFNLDGRTFLKTIVKEDLIKRLKNESNDSKLHIVMNLPASAIEFLDAFKDLLIDSDIDGSSEQIETSLPQVHCYCFTKDIDNSEKDVKERAENVIGQKLPSDSVVRYVRNVAPNKEMMCLTFNLMAELVFGQKVEPAFKKQKLSQ